MTPAEGWLVILAVRMGLLHPGVKKIKPRRAKIMNPDYLFYAICTDDLPRQANPILPAEYSWVIWRPSFWQAWPPTASSVELKLRFLFRWVLLHLGLMREPECGALLVHDQGQLVHYSGFTSGYWRFPFMDREDMQIGNTWTDPAHRGKGIAQFALRTLVSALGRPGRKLWYVVEATNASSIKVVERAAFTLVGSGTWYKPLGLKLPGSYRILVRHATCTNDAAMEKGRRGEQ
jgi:RimJ/RimL family protein N-acetyltransferase